MNPKAYSKSSYTPVLNPPVAIPLPTDCFLM